MITKIGTTTILKKHKATCHCGKVELEVNFPNGMASPSRCNCSICRRKGAIVAPVSLSDIKIIKGESVLSLYEFNTNTAKHYFCSNCGIYTHHQRRSNQDQYSINLGCLDGVDPFEIDNVPTGDGVNHASDR